MVMGRGAVARADRNQASWVGTPSPSKKSHHLSRSCGMACSVSALAGPPGAGFDSSVPSLLEQLGELAGPWSTATLFTIVKEPGRGRRRRAASGCPFLLAGVGSGME